MLKIVDSGPPSAFELDDMDRRNRRFKLAGLICRTEDMLNLAMAEDWAGLEAMDEARAREFDDYLALARDDDEEDPLIAEALATLLHLNEKIQDKVKSARQAVLEESRLHRTGRAAVSRYQEIDR